MAQSSHRAAKKSWSCFIQYWQYEVFLPTFAYSTINKIKFCKIPNKVIFSSNNTVHLY